MGILECGVLVDGLPVFVADFVEEEEQNSNGDSMIRHGLMSAIQSFAMTAFENIMDTLILSDLKIMFHHIIKKQQDYSIELILYAIADKKTKSIEPIKRALAKIGNAISASDEHIDTFNPSKNDFIQQFIDHEFYDLQLDLDDRITSLFG